MSLAFIVPLVCFLCVSAYGYTWARLRGASAVAPSPATS
jgi:hypothetical protein